MAGLFAAAADLPFQQGAPVLASRLTQRLASLIARALGAMESFSNQASWNNPDRYWISVLTLGERGWERSAATLWSWPGSACGGALRRDCWNGMRSARPG